MCACVVNCCGLVCVVVVDAVVVCVWMFVVVCLCCEHVRFRALVLFVCVLLFMRLVRVCVRVCGVVCVWCDAVSVCCVWLGVLVCITLRLCVWIVCFGRMCFVCSRCALLWFALLLCVRCCVCCCLVCAVAVCW